MLGVLHFILIFNKYLTFASMDKCTIVNMLDTNILYDLNKISDEAGKLEDEVSGKI